MKLTNCRSYFFVAEVDGRDMCCVISCLTLLLVDAHFRTVHGFQSLVQREWVIMGHPFCTRLAHVYSTESNKVNLYFSIYFRLK